MSQPIYTIGHSTHPVNLLVSLLEQHEITAVADVRSKPYSRVNPQYNRESLQTSLKKARISYAFLGEELGARSQDSECYINGKVQYDRLATTPLFRQGLERLVKGMETFKIALLCAEKDPLTCHRTLLVARHLVRRGVEVQHIHATGKLESHDEAMVRLLRELGLPEHDLFRSGDEILAEAYRRRGEEIAYVAPRTPAEVA